jgi:hypothetical protein
MYFYLKIRREKTQKNHFSLTRKYKSSPSAIEVRRFRNPTNKISMALRTIYKIKIVSIFKRPYTCKLIVTHKKITTEYSPQKTNT